MAVTDGVGERGCPVEICPGQKDEVGSGNTKGAVGGRSADDRQGVAIDIEIIGQGRDGNGSVLCSRDDIIEGRWRIVNGCYPYGDARGSGAAMTIADRVREIGGAVKIGGWSKDQISSHNADR